VTLPAGTRLGAYQVLSPLGAGGMGEVYRARDTRLERDVAVKVLPDSLATDADALARFEREAKAVASLSHPHLLAIFDFGRQDGVVYAVTELLDGGTLRDLIGAGPMPRKRALSLAQEIAAGLAAAHEKGVVHRDLKPENVFVTRDGHVKIIDFGLAKRVGPVADGDASTTPTVSQRTEPGVLLGTVAYMSPEQVRGLPAAEPSDIFSFGTLLHELLSGRHPFRKASAGETMAAILTEEPPEIPGLPAGLARLLGRCLEKSAARRYHSASDLAFALDEIATTDRGAAPAGRAAPSRRVLLAVGLSVACAAAVGAGVLWRARSAAPRAQSIAVLPFVNMSSDKENDFFSDGMTEDLISALSHVSGLHVAARTSSFAFKGKNEDVRTIGRMLGVGSILEGSVAKAGDRVRVTAQLIDAANGYHLWSSSWDRDLKDILGLRSELAQAVTSELKVTLQAGERDKLEKKPTSDVEAYQLYLKGRHEVSTFTPEGYENGIRHLQEAIARDPGFALAHLGVAYYYLGSVDIIPGKDALPRARAAAAKALELDPTLAEAHADLGWAAWMLDDDLAGADRELQRAIAMDPRRAYGHEYYGWFLVGTGRTEQGLAESRKAVELDPLSPEVNTVLGFNLYFARRFDEAAAQLRTTAAIDPDYGWGREYLGRCYLKAGRRADAVAELERARKLMGDVTEIVATLALARGGDAPKTTLAELGRANGYVPSYFPAILHLALGDRDRAFELLSKAVEERTLFTGWIGVDPDLDPLRGDPRFAALRTSVGLPAR
jgi:serine/threonine-protein kinase